MNKLAQRKTKMMQLRGYFVGSLRNLVGAKSIKTKAIQRDQDASASDDVFQHINEYSAAVLIVC